MKTISKKILSGTLLLAGSLPVLFALFFLVKQQMIRHKMLEELEHRHLQTITLPAEDVHWVKKGIEIWVQGKMFDIKYFSEKNGQFTCTGLFDEEETALNKQVEKDFNQKNESGNRMLTQLFQWLQAVYPGAEYNDLFALIIERRETSFYSLKIPSVYTKILTPPPRSVYSIS